MGQTPYLPKLMKTVVNSFHFPGKFLYRTHSILGTVLNLTPHLSHDELGWGGNLSYVWVITVRAF